MKASTAIKQTSAKHSVQFFGGQYIVSSQHNDNRGRYTTSSNSMPHCQAVQLRKQKAVGDALLLLGYDDGQEYLPAFVDPRGSALELLQRCIDHINNC